MSLTRREFMKRSALALPAALMAAKSGGIMAAPAPGVTRNVIFIELFGGNDGLNTLVPWGYAPYYNVFRPNLAIPAAQVLKVAGQPVGFNPVLAGLKGQFDAGRLAIIQGVSYPNPILSHAYSRRVWQSGDPMVQPSGWLMRYLNTLPPAAFPEIVELTRMQPTFSKGKNGFVPVFQSLPDFKFPVDTLNPADTTARQAAYAALAAAVPPDSSPLAITGTTAGGTLSLINTFGTIPGVNLTGQYSVSVLSALLKQVVGLINANMGMRFFHLSTGGFDTHSGQMVNNLHNLLLQDVNDSLMAFYTDLLSIGVAQDTLIVVYSEFGRTVYENGTLGTDHGTVNPVLVFGGAGVNGGFVNPHPPVDPTLLDPITGQLQAQIDFRDVFGTILMRWCGVSQADASAVFMGHPVADLGFLV